jgi:hypothetical protein
MPDETPEQPAAARNEAFYSTVKSNLFRLVRADGCLLQPDLKGDVRVSFYSDRIGFDGQVVAKRGGSVVKLQDYDEYFEREIEVEVSMSLQSLEDVHKNIGTFIEWLRSGGEKP